MPMTDDDLPEDYDALKAAFIEMRAKVSGAEALIAHLQLVIAKMKRELYGPRSERSQRLIDQLELQLEDLIAAAGEAKAETERANPVQGHMRRPTTRRNFPDHLERRRIVHPAPTSCPCCGGTKLSKIGEDVTERLDVVPRQLFVTEHVREKFSCRSCEKISQPPAPFHTPKRRWRAYTTRMRALSKATKKGNALKHGANAKEVMLWSEKYEDYESLRAELYLEFTPSGSTEEHLVQTLLDLRWRRRRLDCYERITIQKRLNEIRQDNKNSRDLEYVAAFAPEFKEADSVEKVEAILSRLPPGYREAILSNWPFEVGAEPAIWGFKIGKAL